MTLDRYILDEQGRPVQEPDFDKWLEWFGDIANRKVAVDRVGEVEIFTLFLGLEHRFGERPPELWETTVVGGSLDREQARCSGTREQAEAMHAQMVERVKQGA